jgi:uncharacterized protein YhaN
MRLLELQLIAFGPFTDHAIDLSAPGLQVIYGPNEAGKSTALRAIAGLLFGIDERSPDAYLHPYDKLRIGAVIDHGGERLEVVRSKKRKQSLSDRSGQSIDEARLKRFLGGVTPALFGSMFGLNHQSLRDGARALLRGEGDLGESLFDAGGARGVGDVLARLRQEADAIFKPRGQKQTLNAALAALKTAREAVKLRSVEPKAVTDQRDALAAAEARRASLAARRIALEAERQRLARLERVMPRLGRRRELVGQRAALGEVPRLPADAAEQRLVAERAIDRAERDAERLGREIAERQAAIAGLVVDREILALGPMPEIEERLGRHRSAAADRPKREAERKIHEREIGETLQALGRTEANAVVDRPAQRRIERLVRQHEAIVAELAATERSVKERERELAALGAEDVVVATEALEVALRGARRLGEVDAQIATLTAEEARAARERAELEREIGGAASPPSREDVARALDALRDDELQIERLEERRRALVEERGRVIAELAALTAAGEVPTRDAVVAARRRRDEALIENGRRLEALSALVAEADELADRMLAEVERVTRHARLEAERDRIGAELAASEESRSTLVARRDARQAALAAAWPAPPAAIIGHLDRRDQWLRLRSEAERLSVELSEKREARRRALAALDQALGDESVTDELAPAVDRAEVRLGELREQAARQRQRQEARAQAGAALAALEGDLATRQEMLESWRAQWGESMTAIGLARDASADEALALLEALRDLGDRLHALRESRRRLEGIDRDAQAFEALVRPIVARVLPEASDRPIAEAAEELLAAARQATTAATRREQLQAEIDARAADLAAAREGARGARDVLEQLVRAAGVSAPAELALAEQRAELARRLDESISEVEASLVTEGSLEELEALAEGRDLDEVRARRAEQADILASLENELSDLDRDIGSIRHGLERYDQQIGAFGEALDVESQLAEIEDLATRWAKLRLAARILEGEIRAYREKNQGPIIERASALFPRLTLGEYQRLRVEFDASDEPRLLCIGVDGSEVSVEALSDGARDQLYLALRLASLERYADHAELLPFVADDILVHFDEDRARRSLEVLADFCAIGQVLLFTHHARHVELAREVLGDRLHLHVLEGGHRRARVAHPL